MSFCARPGSSARRTRLSSFSKISTGGDHAPYPLSSVPLQRARESPKSLLIPASPSTKALADLDAVRRRVASSERRHSVPDLSLDQAGWVKDGLARELPKQQQAARRGSPQVAAMGACWGKTLRSLDPPVKVE